MATKVRTGKENKGKSKEIIGLSIAAVGFILLISLLSYDYKDISLHASDQKSNWCGWIGAWLAYYFYIFFGISAYLTSLVAITWGLSLTIKLFSHLKTRWPWMLLLTATFSCGLDLASRTFLSKIAKNVSHNISSSSLGGWLGHFLNDHFFGMFGVCGATTIFLTIYLICLLGLTNLELDDWIGLIFEKLKQIKVRRVVFDEPKKKGSPVKNSPCGESDSPRNKENPPQNEETAQRSTIKEIERGMDAPKLLPDIAKRFKKEPDVSDVYPLKDEQEITNTQYDDKKNIKDSENVVNSTVVERISKKNTATGTYELPSLNLLNEVDECIPETSHSEDDRNNIKCIQETYQHFNLEVRPTEIVHGPTITLYEFEPLNKGVKLSRFSSLYDNLLASLKVEAINIHAPIPGKENIGIEVPNRIKRKVVMKELFQSDDWRNSRAKLPIALGKDIYGRTVIADLADTPHLLIAGSTGAGKSVCINSIITSLVYRFTPDELRFVMVDPKVVELQEYNNLPHMVVPVVTDPKKVMMTLKWVISEMERRYEIFAKVKVRKIESFNERPLKIVSDEPTIAEQASKNTEGFAVEMEKEEINVPRDDEMVIPDRLSYIVVIIDELADLMAVARKEIESLIQRIMQKARAAGIHCIVATQRPSTDVITGVIKANIPCRIAFKVTSIHDSRTILDRLGAERLLGKGDMLFLPPGKPLPVRVQGALITDNETEAVLNFVAEQAKPNFEKAFLEKLSQPEDYGDTEEDNGEDEELIQRCIDVIYSSNRASTSMLQRALHLGYNRAARIMDTLERRGIVGPNRGAEGREIITGADVND